MDDAEEIADSDKVGHKRAVKYTHKAQEERLNRLVNLRKSKMAQITIQMKEIDKLKENDENVEKIEQEVLTMLTKLYQEFIELNENTQELLLDDEKEDDQRIWFEPKSSKIRDFILATEQWIEHVKDASAAKNEEIEPGDSVSEVASATRKKSRAGSSAGHSSVALSASSSSSRLRMKEEAEKAALLAKAASLKKKQALQLEEINLKAKLEQLELQTAIAVSNAKLKVYDEHGSSGESMHGYVQPKHAVNERRSGLRKDTDDGSSDAQAATRRKQKPVTDQTRLHNASQNFPKSENSEDNLFQIMKRQNEITQMLVKQQNLSQLPQRDVPIFLGDPLNFRAFMRAFDNSIDSKTENAKDKLFYLEQYTSGEPQDLVRSCGHMSAENGYKEARRLLQHHYGDELKIASAYIEKALKWPQIKSEDGKLLSAYALFLIGCHNTMQDVDYMAEMDNPTNMRVVISKLPYKMRENWRNVAYDIHERTGRRARFSDLVEYIDRQAKVKNDPLFGDIQEQTSADVGKKSKASDFKQKKVTTKGSSFVTSVSTEQKKESETSNRGTKAQLDKTVCARCLFCQKNHALNSCFKFKEQAHLDKIEFLKTKGLCFGCLTQGHLSKDCKRRLTCQECSKMHPSILHIAKENSLTSSSCDENKPGRRTASIDHETCGYTGAGNSECILAIVPVKIKSKKSNKIVKTFAFIDQGSSATFCTESLMRDLNLRGRKTEILLRTMGQEKSVHSHILSDLEISGLESEDYIELPKVFTQKEIPVKQENIPHQQDLEKWPYLRQVNLPHLNAEVGLLIGANAHKAIEPWQIINSEGNGPYAIRTALGWIVNGPLRTDVSAESDQVRIPSFTVNRIAVSDIETLLVEQFNADFPERKYSDKNEMSQEDLKFMQSVEQSVQYKDGHYCIGLPFKKDPVKMPNNRCIAEQRAISLKRKLSKNQEFHKDYKAFMADIIDKGYAKKVPSEQLERTDRVWYIPHHGIYHPKKNKIRVVFDCTATYQNFSLNNQLLQGPDLTNTLIGVLNRFRQEPIAIMADIEAMFYQVKVPDHDTDLLRFLWWPEGDLSKPTEEYRMMVHLFGATSSPSCACFALRKAAMDGKTEETAEAANTILQNFYMDDCLKSVASEDAAIKLSQNLISMCSKGGFHLTKWVSNSRSVLLSFPETERSKEVRNLDFNKSNLPVERALGVQWCTESDSFRFSINVQERPATRRGMLSVVSSIYDPLGLVSPCILPAKLILRQLCKDKLGWDQNMPEKQAQQWFRWQKDIQQLSDFSVSRCFKPNNFGPTESAQLHHFADASENGYGTVSYLVLTNEHGEKHCSFVMGKSRVAPLKQVTIPRMELTAAVVAAKMDRMLKQELQLQLKDSVFWTDSLTVLQCIENEASRFKTFVANRVSFIREASEPSQWRYVGTSLNPADMASRGIKVENFMKKQNWIKGPEFLCKHENEWPLRPDQASAMEVELKNSAVVNCVSATEKRKPMDKLIEYYSEWYRLKRAIAWMLRLKEILLHLSNKRCEIQATISQTENNPNKQQAHLQTQMFKLKQTLTKKPLSVEDVEDAELSLIRYSQRQTFPDEFKSLQSSNHVKRSSPLSKLDPVVQDGILRVGGRLNQSAMPESAKHPAILDKKQHITSLILKDIHKNTGHSGRNQILAKLRNKFWVGAANTAIRKLISKCTVCRRLNARVSEQKMAELPRDRLMPDEPPFTHVGVDFFGPFLIKRARSIVKRYGVLFTCLTIRAVHIEVANSLDTSSCINAIRRFICRRGQASTIRSDNGTNFIGAERELKEAIQELDQSKIAEVLVQKGIKWIFNTPAASHQGGVWERQIRTVRKILNSVLNQQILDDEGLHTVLCEVEAIINDRPITKASDDPNDLEPLTPNHLLLMKKQPVMPPGVFVKEDCYSRRRWRQIQYMADLFWSRWTKEYLPLLQERQKWQKLKRNLVPGDIVLIVDNSAPRNSWIMGRILKTTPDASGIVRRACVQTKTCQLDRPISKLCLLQEAEEE